MAKWILLIIPFALASHQAQAQQTVRVDEVTGATTWQSTDQGVTFSLTQLLPDQLRAFYVNRGFSLKQIDEFANSCVFMTVLRNGHAASTIHFNQQRWRVQVGDHSHALVPVNEWLDRLEKAQSPRSALLAFRWAQFPPEQSYQPGGDWNQGMLSVGLKPGSRFDITAVWEMQGQDHASHLQEVYCVE